MVDDRVSELYYGQIMPEETQEACRQRIRWMCARAEGKTVLDLGCSQGIASILLATEGFRVIGADVDPEALEYAKADLSKRAESIRDNVEFRLISAGPLPFADAEFETVLAGEILEHQTNPMRLLREFARILRPGGRLIVTVPFGLHPHPEHAQTFYLSNLIALLEGEFAIEELEVPTKHILCAARKSPCETTSPTSAERLLEITEQAIARAEAAYDRHKKRLDQRIASLTPAKQEAATQRDKLNKLSRAVHGFSAGMAPVAEVLRVQLGASSPRLRKSLTTLLEQCAAIRDGKDAAEASEHLSNLSKILNLLAVELRSELSGNATRLEAATTRQQELESHVGRQRELIRNYKAECERKFEEVRYRIGDAFVLAARHPVDFLKLPWRLTKLVFVGIGRCKLRRDQERATKKKATPVLTGPAVTQSKIEEKYTFQPVTPPERPPRTSFKVAAIFDTFTLECFRAECQLILVTPDEWREQLETDRPDFLFVESAWKGNDGAWSSQLTRAEHIEDSPLLALIEWCKNSDIPTVFWNKEDPPNFEHFIFVASHFDHIFTTDAHCIPQYKERVDHDRVYALPFAAQVDIHNPIDSQREKYANLCFAGTYYAKRHDARKADVELLLKPALSRGLQIFDRMHGYKESNFYRFPAEYRPNILGSLPYPEMVDAYKRYRVFLNVNSVHDSPTMFSRRVFELLACGTPVISTYSRGIEEILGQECAPLVKTTEEAEACMDRLLAEPDLRDRMVLLGQRKIFSQHTYTHRFREVLEKLELAVERDKAGVSVVTCTNRPANLENCIANYERQAWQDKEFVLVLNSDEFDLKAVEKRLESVPDARVFQLPEKASLGECLNHAFDRCRQPYLTKCDDDNYHAEHFLTDLMHAFLYTEADLVGKCTYYAFLEGDQRLALRFPRCEHRYVRFLSGSAMIFPQRVFEKVRFPERSVGEDTHFLRACEEYGFRMYSTDRFSYFVRRGKSLDEHTWKIEDAEYMKKCETIAFFDPNAASREQPAQRDGHPVLTGDPRDYVTV